MEKDEERKANDWGWSFRVGALVLAFWSPFAEGIVASLFGCSGLCEKKSDSNEDEEGGEALAAAANDEANKWKKTRRERLMTGDDDEKWKGKRNLYILDFRKNFLFLA